MQSRNRILDDLARVAGGALGVATGMREEVEARLRGQFERVLGRMDMVTREDFEVVRAMVAKARQEQEALADRLAALEARLEASAAKPRATRKTAPKRAAKPAAKSAAKSGAKSGARKKTG